MKPRPPAATVPPEARPDKTRRGTLSKPADGRRPEPVPAEENAKRLGSPKAGPNRWRPEEKEAQPDKVSIDPAGLDTLPVAVIIPSRNRAEDLRRCLTGVAAQEPAPAEVVVVDDASDDGTAEMVRREFPDVTVMRFDNRIGASTARNAAVARASTEFVWFLDSDSEPTTRDCLTALLSALQDDETIGSVGGEICRSDDGRLFIREKHIRINGETASRDIRLDPTVVGDTDYLPTCNLLMRRDLVAALGGFDPAYVVLSEDKELGWRIGRRGLRNVIVGAAPVVHHVSRQYRKGDLFRKLRNTTRFAIINLPWWRILILPWLDLACLFGRGKFRALKSGGVSVTKHLRPGAARVVAAKRTPTVVKLLLIGPRYLACLLAAYAWNKYHILGSLKMRRRRPNFVQQAARNVPP